MFFPDVPGPSTPGGDVVDPALPVGVYTDELLKPEDEHVGPEPAVEQAGVPRAGEGGHTLGGGQEAVPDRNTFTVIVKYRHQVKLSKIT